jgi:hypothetical protein
MTGGEVGLREANQITLIAHKKRQQQLQSTPVAKVTPFHAETKSVVK